MKTSSAKSKGRKACSELKAKLEATYPDYPPQDLKITTSGEPGPDLQTYGRWNELGLVFECKNQEALNVWAALKQAETHTKKTPGIPVLAFKRNRTELYVALKADDFLKLIS